MERTISIYQFGTSDVANYGDLLFPLLAQKRLNLLNAEVTAISPKGNRPVWQDCFPSYGSNNILDIPDAPNGVLIGGGNIIKLKPSKLQDYDHGSLPLFAYPDIWVGASFLAENDIPVCWNAPGVPFAFTGEQRPLVRDCIERCSYVSVRDQQSRDLLLDAHPGADISVFPDPAWEISRFWTSSQLGQAYQKMFSSRGRDAAPRAISVHLNSRYMAPESDEAVARALDVLASRFDAQMVLLAIGPCHRDDALARKVGNLMTTEPLVVDEPASLVEIACAISNSLAYIGSSLHGLITALSFGVPGICVTNGKLTKFQGLQAQIPLPDIWSKSWKSIPEQLSAMELDSQRRQIQIIRKQMIDQVDRHWERILDCFKHGIHESQEVPQKDARLKREAANLSYRRDYATILALRHFADSETKGGAEYYRKELNKVYSSYSWRYTYPIRKLSRLLKLHKIKKYRNQISGLFERACFWCQSQISGVFERAHFWCLSIGLSRSKVPEQPADEIHAGKDMSVIVSIHDSPEFVWRCLCSLEIYGALAEVILVDDGSQEKETLDILEEFSQKNDWRLVRHDDPVGHSRACEAGARLATRPYLCLLNSDAVVTPWSWLAAKRAFETDPEIAVAGPSTSWAITRQALPKARKLRHYWNDNQIFSFSKKYIASLETSRPVELTEVSGFAFFIRRNIWEEFEGFDDKLPDYGNESELCIRLLKAGWKIVWTPDSYIHHFGNISYVEEKGRKTRFSRWYIEKKHGSRHYQKPAQSE
jgi:GT2 family glycosyltransferase/polysaccharide pyruvyl transferase WcaK-like protein